MGIMACFGDKLCGRPCYITQLEAGSLVVSLLDWPLEFFIFSSGSFKKPVYRLRSALQDVVQLYVLYESKLQEHDGPNVQEELWFLYCW